MQDKFYAYLITNDKNLENGTKSEYSNAKIISQRWFDAIELTSEYDVVIIDGKLQSLTPNRSNGGNVRSLKESFRTLSDAVKLYLKSGGVVIFLNYDNIIQNSRLSNSSASSHGWISQLNLPECVESSKTHSVKPTTESPAVSRYFDYIDETNMYTDLSLSDLSVDVLATSRNGDKPVSVAFSEYKDHGGHTRKSEGSILFLTRPNSFRANPSGILRTLIEVGAEYSPRGFDKFQRRLPEFHGRSSEDQDSVDYLIDSQLAERCLEKYHRGEYTDTVSTAGRILEDRVKGLCPPAFKDKTGRKLMTDAFNNSDGPIRLAERDDEQAGVMFMFTGAIAGIRNVAVHRPNGGDDIIHNFDRETTRGVLFYIDYLLNLLDEYEQNDLD